MFRCLLILMLLMAAPRDLRSQSFHGFVTVPEATYMVGRKGDVQNPLRRIILRRFRIAATETTNRQFDSFVRATHYVTDAERHHDAHIFEPGMKEFRWKVDPTAYWRYPNGVANGGIELKMDHPVTCISYNDVLAYCRWAGVRLPTLEEWEAASRAGSPDNYFWGEDQQQIGLYANIWHGPDHSLPDTGDGYLYTAPVASFAPNSWGLYDVYGNVFEFCQGKLAGDRINVAHARGGSWWCSRNSCSFFNSVDIGTVNRYASFSNQGFRVVVDMVPR